MPRELALELSRSAERRRGDALLCDPLGRPVAPWTFERALRTARGHVPGLDPQSRFHDLRHYYASLLISEGLDVKVVQARMRHPNATITLNVYGHMFPDKDETSRAAVGRAMAAREVSRAQIVRTSG
jgi:integrase